MPTKAKAKVFMTGRSQAVRLPKDYRFEGDTVLIHRDGVKVILEPVPANAAAWFAAMDRAGPYDAAIDAPAPARDVNFE